MYRWPVPHSYSNLIPAYGQPGSFWEERGDRYHCGADIYAPEGTEVLAIEEGGVLSTLIATSPEFINYWNTTYSILIQTYTGFYCRYAELGEIFVKEGEFVNAGDPIGLIGCVLNIDLIDANAPPYIQKLRQGGNVSMLHFELYTRPPQTNPDYFGGNWLGKGRPIGLIDPTNYLNQILIDSSFTTDKSAQNN